MKINISQKGAKICKPFFTLEEVKTEEVNPTMARDTHCGIRSEREKQGVLPKGQGVFCTLQPPNIFLSSKARSSSHNSPSHGTKLTPILFSLHVPLRATSPESSAVTEVVTFTAPMRSSALPLKLELSTPHQGKLCQPQHWVLGSDQPPAPLKLERIHSYSKPNLAMSTLHCKVIKKPGKSVKDEKRPALSSMV